ncbi:SPFH domain-containing protein [Methanococcus maripaludis]|uniref:Band 7 protein:Stomatin n=1 Tax=Methanococcus maripaludis (strain DSM 14266 / JCM 13030 / NBRC 101832 / S2 / LL) TaxID=267377 RepID=Q6LYF5_METMP|nr:SPFH domain-containing protein [Methanococcus maripaludis]CAF30592.1 Band 7 protein:Stomatin [Methanococcus maripaludis S2]
MSFWLNLLLGIFLLVLIIKSVIIVNQFELGLIFRLGKVRGRLNPGVNFIIPFIDVPIKVDVRTKVIDVPPQEMITRDNAGVRIDAVIYYRVMDVNRAILEVQNFQYAIINLAQTSLRAIIGSLELDDALNKREFINSQLLETLDRDTDAWGVKVEKVELREIEPPTDIKNAMTQQMKAERLKRAAILEAEGEKQSKILKAQGTAESMKIEAEGQAKAIQIVAESAQNYFKNEAQLYKALDVTSNTLKDNTKFVISENIMDVAKKFIKQ